jgi:hypothetical protein
MDTCRSSLSERASKTGTTASPLHEIVVDLKRRNWSDAKIGKELGMDQDEVLRLTQISGLTEMFQDRSFSQAWSESEDGWAAI